MARKNSEEQSAPELSAVDRALAPFVRQGSVDVSGGHYDAGDYSKYVTNSAALIGTLIFAVDHFPGVDAIDNLGLPESGDGVPDALQIAKWEVDFLLKMQDADRRILFPRVSAGPGLRAGCVAGGWGSAGGLPEDDDLDRGGGRSVGAVRCVAGVPAALPGGC